MNAAASGASTRPGRPGCVPARGRRSHHVESGPRRAAWQPIWRNPPRRDGTTADGEFWYATTAKLLAPLFFAAAHDGRSMADVLRWVDTQEAGEVSIILEQIGVVEVLDAARASWCRDERTRSSVYTTAETVLAPFAGDR